MIRSLRFVGVRASAYAAMTALDRDAPGLEPDPPGDA
jgi:hypothetical protein